MTGAEFRAARDRLGLSARAMAEALRMGENGGRTIRRYESGERPISGPLSLAVKYLLEREKK